MLKPRPSLNFGKSTAISAILSKSSTSSAGSSSGASHTPIGSFLCAAVSAFLCSFHHVNGTITLAGKSASTAGSVPSSPARTTVQSSSTTSRFLIIKAMCLFLSDSSMCRLARRVHAFLERRDADTAICLDEPLAFNAVLNERIDHLRHHVRHLFRRERRTNHAAEMRARCARALLAAERDLIPLRAVFIDTEHTDVADVMMTARVDTTRDVERQVAEVVHVVEIAETLLNRLRNRDRLGVRERAEIAARARHDVGQQTNIRC